jgi:hypothetical protein
MARRIMNRKELRALNDAAERRQQDTEEVAENEEEVEDEESEEEAVDASDEEGGEEEEEDEVAPKPKKKAAKPAAAKPKRTRAVKVVRMKVVWGVFNNSNQRVASFDYPKRKDADEMAAKLTVDKKNTHFVQPIKEEIK